MYFHLYAQYLKQKQQKTLKNPFYKSVPMQWTFLSVISDISIRKNMRWTGPKNNKPSNKNKTLLKNALLNTPLRADKLNKLFF